MAHALFAVKGVFRKDIRSMLIMAVDEQCLKRDSQHTSPDDCLLIDFSSASEVLNLYKPKGGGQSDLPQVFQRKFSHSLIIHVPNRQ